MSSSKSKEDASIFLWQLFCPNAKHNIKRAVLFFILTYDLTKHRAVSDLHMGEVRVGRWVFLFFFELI